MSSSLKTALADLGTVWVFADITTALKDEGFFIETILQKAGNKMKAFM